MERRNPVSIARTTEIVAESTVSFDDAIKQGIERANKTLENVKGAWIKDQKIICEKGKITAYRVNMKVTFVLRD